MVTTKRGIVALVNLLFTVEVRKCLSHLSCFNFWFILLFSRAKEVKIGGQYIGRRVKKVVKRNSMEPPKRTSPSHHSMNTTMPPSMSMPTQAHVGNSIPKNNSGTSHHQRASTAPASSHQVRLLFHFSYPLLPQPFLSYMLSDSPVVWRWYL